MIEWITADHAEIETFPPGDHVHGYNEPVGYDGATDMVNPGIHALGIAGSSGDGVMLEGTPGQLLALARRILARAQELHRSTQETTND